MTTYTSGLTSGRPSLPLAMCGDAAMMLAACAVEAARQLGVGALPEHQHVLVGAGAGERRAETVRQRQHADEHRHDQRDAERGERGRDRPLQHAAHVVDERDLHSTVLSAWTTGSRAARSAGTSPLASMSRSAMPPPSSERAAS